jgi:uncharacterized protein
VSQHRGPAFTVPSADAVPWQPPVADPFTAPWWAACRERRLLVRRCRACGEAHFPPRPACPRCWSDDVVWEDCSGAGTLHTYSVVRTNDIPAFSGAVPYVAAIVEVAEGPRLMTTLVDSPAAAVAVNAPVQVVFVDRDDWTFPAFRIVAPRQG